MPDERSKPNGPPSNEVAPATRFLLIEPAPASAPPETEAPATPAAHSFRVGVAPYTLHDTDLLTGRPIAATPGELVPALFFRLAAADADPEQEMDAPISGAAACAGPAALRAAVEAALVRIDAEVEEAEWRRRVLQALLAAEVVGSAWSQP